MKLKWKIEEAPTGRYRSFHKRGWPTGFWLDKNGEEQFAFFLISESSYEPREVKTGNHHPITIVALDRSVEGKHWVQRKLVNKAATLSEAKERAQRFFDQNPEKFEIQKVD